MSVKIMNGKYKKGSPGKEKRFYITLLLLVATMIVAGSLVFNLYKLNEEFSELERAEARASFAKDIIYRHWNASHGGVYVPITKDTPSNPYLADQPDRDITTLDGKKLTLMNPAYMTKEVFGLVEKELGIKNHITSLKPLRPENKPDNWEREALLSFEQGAKEFSRESAIDNEPYVRLMRPLYVEKGCLKCHGHQGYKVGDVRGGISVSVPMKRYYASMNKFRLLITAEHFFVWLICIFFIHFGGKKLLRKTEELKSSHDFIEATFNSVHDPIAVIDVYDLTLIKTNSAFLSKYDKDGEGVIGKRCYEILKRRTTCCIDANLPCPLLGTRKTMGVVTQEHLHLSKDGQSLFYTEVTTSPIYDNNGNVDSVIHITRDITERRRFEESLKEAKENAETANLAKSNLINMVSHDVRNPLNAIIGMTELALETDPSSKQNKYLEIVKQSSYSMLSLLNDVLDLSKVEAGKLELETISFRPADVISGSVDMFRFTAEKRGLALSYHIAPEVPQTFMGDPTRLRQVLVNLLGNAIKFTERGKISVNVSKIGNGSDGRQATLHFTVKDTGIGIPDDKKDKIFEGFTQADSSTARKYGGTGLGLTISQHIVQLMNGRLWVDSTHGEGSTFHFTAQLGVEGEEKPADLKGVLNSPLKPLRILLVDDAVMNQVLAVALLEKNKHRVSIAKHGREAVDMLSRELFDLVFMDVQMPEMDGIEATRHIRSLNLTAPNRNVPIIAMTGNVAEEDRNTYLRAGMNDYIAKPLQTTELFRVIEQWAPATHRDEWSRKPF